MAFTVPGVPFQLTKENIGGLGGFDLGEAIKSGLNNYNLFQESKFKPRNLENEAYGKELLNKINEAKAKYAEQHEQADIDHLAAQSALSQGNLSLIPFYKNLYKAQAESAAAKASQARSQETMYENLRNGIFSNQPSMDNLQDQKSPADYLSMLKGQQEFPQGTSPSMVSGLEPRGGQLPGRIDKDDIIRGLTYKAFGLTPPSSKENVLTGAARDAESMRRLREMYGNDSREVKDAEAIQNTKKQRDEDLSEIRHRQLNGLKPGDLKIKDPDTGETIGYSKQTTDKQKETFKNMTLFNELFPLVYKGASPFVGADAAYQLEQVIRKSKTDPESEKKLIAFMIADKALTNTTISEAARFNAGRTNQTYNRYADSLKTENITPKLKKWLKEYGISPKVQYKAGVEWQKVLNNAEKKANKSVPARQNYYFDPDKQFEHENAQRQSREDELLEPEDKETSNAERVVHINGQKKFVPVRDIQVKNGKEYAMIDGAVYELSGED